MGAGLLALGHRYLVRMTSIYVSTLKNRRTSGEVSSFLGFGFDVIVFAGQARNRQRK